MNDIANHPIWMISLAVLSGTVLIGYVTYAVITIVRINKRQEKE
ncbi:MAG: hypothetical protein PHW40_05945 [Candidatus Izemoplasmatales bacterium]|nr:hypothetical protein [Candidatus Izemoplasmatales bacterium]